MCDDAAALQTGPKAKSNSRNRNRNKYNNKTHAKNPSPQTQSASAPVCRFHNKVPGGCRFGSQCRFLHLDKNSSTQTQTQPQVPRRTYCPMKAAAVRLASALQDAERRPFWANIDNDDNDNDNEYQYFGIDVECVATGYGHLDRAPGRVAIVDAEGKLVLDQLLRLRDRNADADREADADTDVKADTDEQSEPSTTSTSTTSNQQSPNDEEEVPQVVSYLTPLTGLTPQMFTNPKHPPLPTLPQLRTQLHSLLTQQTPTKTKIVFVGQSVKHDLDWLQMKQGQDYHAYADICLLFRKRVPPTFNSPEGFCQFAESALYHVVQHHHPNQEGYAPREVDKEAVRLAAVQLKQAASQKQSLQQQPLQHSQQLSQSARAKTLHHDTTATANTSSTTPPSVSTTQTLSAPPPPQPYSRYRIFSLRHTCLHLLQTDIQSAHHDPIIDARYAMQLFQLYRKASVEKWRFVREALHRAPGTPNFIQSVGEASLRVALGKDGEAGGEEEALMPSQPVFFGLLDGGVCLSPESYKYKYAGRMIWRWYCRCKEGQKEPMT